jgi:uncharacterized membrane protein YoaT (DUF817 family)
MANSDCAHRATQGRWSAFFYEFLWFGIKQGWACLFGGLMLTLLIGTWLWYPTTAPLARYDFLFLSALALQIVLLALKFETLEEAGVILIYHVVGTVMEYFKTAVGSWMYPEYAFFRIGGVPLFTGFMYACIGSFIARCWRLCDFRFTGHPPVWSVLALAVLMYANFFTHHYLPDMRWALIVAAFALFSRSWIWFRVWRVHRRMPLLVACALTTLFIWFAENIGTYTRAWIYPSQIEVWSLVSVSKLSSWFMLLILSYALVALVTRPRNMSEMELAALER